MHQVGHLFTYQTKFRVRYTTGVCLHFKWYKNDLTYGHIHIQYTYCTGNPVFLPLCRLLHLWLWLFCSCSNSSTSKLIHCISQQKNPTWNPFDALQYVALLKCNWTHSCLVSPFCLYTFSVRAAECDAVLMTVCCVVVCQVQRRSEGAGFIHQACRSSSNVFAVISGWPHWPVHHHPAAQPPLLPSSFKTSSIEIGAFQLFLSPCSCFISAQFDKLQKMTMLHFPLVFLMLTLCSVQPTLFFVCT